jgi:hypothetical protein
MVAGRRAVGSIAYSSTGFARFFDDLVTHGLEYMGLYYGCYRAEVVSTDDPDQEGQPDPFGRLTVVVPAVDGASRLTRRVAYPMVPIGGPSYGFKSFPPVGGFVWVEFERGRVDLPVWKGGWFAQGDIPDDLKPNEAHGWFTPAGHQILMDGQEGAEFIRVKHKNGSSLIELDSQGSIFITNSSGQKVNVGDGADTANEPAVLGTTLKGFLEQILDAIVALTVPTGVGPSGTPINAAQFVSIKAQLQRALSTTINLK